MLNKTISLRYDIKVAQDQLLVLLRGKKKPIHDALKLLIFGFVRHPASGIYRLSLIAEAPRASVWNLSHCLSTYLYLSICVNIPKFSNLETMGRSSITFIHNLKIKC